mmetsp:Transcript_18173/g.51268  ORF Transcript_18173/g.51268 Transcript_18173/m.51268 type:complete len:214 (-) Transcript_18173:817-1458(-)
MLRTTPPGRAWCSRATSRSAWTSAAWTRGCTPSCSAWRCRRAPPRTTTPPPGRIGASLRTTGRRWRKTGTRGGGPGSSTWRSISQRSGSTTSWAFSASGRSGRALSRACSGASGPRCPCGGGSSKPRASGTSTACATRTSAHTLWRRCSGRRRQRWPASTSLSSSRAASGSDRSTPRKRPWPPWRRAKAPRTGWSRRWKTPRPSCWSCMRTWC